MRVLLTGAYGLIGSACLARLQRDGHDLVAAGRALAVARRRFPYAHWIAADFAQLRTGAAWRPLLAGFDAVVNCVGVLQDSARDDVRQVQSGSTKALFDGCVAAGVRRVVHVSAIGAEADGPSTFSRTKAEAEAYLRTLPLDWVVLRPGFVLAPAVYGGSALLRALAAFPAIVPLGRPEARMQVVSADNVAETVARALAPASPARVTWDVAHPQVHTLADIAGAMRAWLGIAPGRMLRVPDAVVGLVGRAADAVGWLGWRSPARTTSVAQLAAGVVGDPAAWTAATGIRPQDLKAILAARPSNVQDRWFARLYLLKPLAIAGLALAAITTGVLRFADYARLADGLVRAGATDLAVTDAALSLVVGALEIAAGAGLLVRATARAALSLLLALAGLQVLQHAFAWPDGPLALLAFDLPLVLAILFTLAILDER